MGSSHAQWPSVRGLIGSLLIWLSTEGMFWVISLASFVRLSHPEKLLIFCAAAVASFAFAERAFCDQEPISSAYLVAEDCPSDREFLSDVRSRTSVAIASDGRDARRFIVTLKRAPDGRFLGQLSVLGPDSATSMPREVTDANCLEVVRTLALATALAIDPSASTGQSTIGSEEPKPPLPLPVEMAEASPGLTPHEFGPSGVPKSTATGVPLGRPARQVPRNEWRPQLASPSTSPHQVSPSNVGWLWSGGLQAFGLFHVAPVAVFGGGAFAALEPRGAWILWPDFRVTAAYAASTRTWTSAEDEGVGITWRWLLVRVEGCPVRLQAAQGGLAVRFCGLMDGGALTSTGVLENPETTTKGWLAAGPAIRLTLDLGPTLYTDFETALIFPVTRWSYTYKDRATGPDQVTNPMRTVGGTIGWGIGFRFR